MEYLVTMTTQVPPGTSARAVDEMRAREAARSKVLVAEGHLLRLWRPPLQPGEWRTLGLFAATDEAELDQVLTSMPLRAWRTDDITPLGPHPNDPPVNRAPASGPEFFTTFTVQIPTGTSAASVAAVEGAEAKRAAELAGQGHLLRLWALPGPSRNLGLWKVAAQDELEAIVASLPFDDWMTTEILPLSPHPSDPGLLRTS